LNEVRIIGGKWKRRKLAFPDRPTLRPTPNRARETLFNWLAGHLDAARCLDLFAGSGALAFEALSRGAQHATLVDNDAQVVRALQKSRDQFAADNCTIIQSSALDFLRETTAVWDVVFLDPPFDGTLLEQSLDALRNGMCIHAASIVYAETSIHDPPALPQWRVWKSGRAGEVQSMLLLAI
jgi:16S rRNA (guanine966-N2)-methyltransferase